MAPLADRAISKPDNVDSLDEVVALRADVDRLGRMVAALAAQPAPTAARAPIVERPHPLSPPMPEGASLTKDDIVTIYQSAAPNFDKTRALASSLDDLIRKEALTSSQVKVDEVDCRGEACKVQVSFADDVRPEPILLGLAAVLPDSHSFQDFAKTADGRRTIASHYIDDAVTARAPVLGAPKR